ncbi:ferredoxin:CoB-CoM heterodisulfide reductase subunit HdrC [Methanobacterium spitsbergense]|uniref:4Fe-4S dicluster domain-containing protein n=1 Tax=Methanobacterium spitsbergense TaxID=2874285 RepID=A0A8T5V3L9_9EURY|nr:ferredoxin:CoB-CoM heterodisulfide reductase subunit HdrC [Methanobacterium spitsbergense]MBZ2166461.1 4Fe-4S dicluster domain-containing protein [Methanobacterium spitsbergense]
MKTIKLKKDPLKLVKDVLNDLKASPDLGIYKCVQCGMCTSVCPGASQTEYDPRDMIRRVLENDETVIDDETIWNCFSCYTCNSVCPSGNNASEVNQILRQMRIDNGNGLKKIATFSPYGDSIIKTGVGSIPNEYFETMINDVGHDYMIMKLNIESMRTDLGLVDYILPKESVNEIESILDNSGFKNRLKKVKRCKK